MNVLEVEASKGWGGQEKRTVRLAQHMDESKVKTLFAAQPDSYLYKNQKELGITVFPVKLSKTYDLFAVWKLTRLIKKHQIDIISTHSGKDAWLGGMAAWFSGIKCIRVRHLQTPFRSTFSYKKLSHAVCTVSEQVRQYVISRGVPQENVHTVYTGVDTDKFKPEESTFRKELRIAEDVILIGIIAVLRAAKRHKDLIEAFAALKDSYNIKLVIVGDGPQWENLQNQIKELGLEKEVFMPGFRDDTVNVLNALDIFVLPSRMEALGTALLEAQACGIPVMGSRVGGIPECISEGESGLLFEAENVEDLKEKLETLLKDQALRERLAHNTRPHIESTFSVKKMVENTIAVYEKVLYRS